MTAYTPATERIVFRGSPPGADAHIRRGYEVLRGAELCARLDIPGQKEPAAMRVIPRAAGDDVTRLHMRLPMSIPVGAYQGTLAIGPEEHSIEVRVDGHSDVSFSPSHLTLMATPGGSEVVDLTAVNRGNLPVEIPGEMPVELMDGEAIPRALHALHEVARGEGKGAKGRDRVGRAADELGRHIETLRVKIEEGAGVINPGELRELRVNVSYPENLTPGRSYVAAWPMANQQLYIVAVHVQARPARKDGEVA